jgi:hypothetical protein
MTCAIHAFKLGQCPSHGITNMSVNCRHYSLIKNVSRIIHAFGLIILFSTMVQSATSDLTLTSSSRYLVDAFNWNKNKALSCVVTGISNNIPCFQAAYSDRDCFCIRDACHQSEGASLLGLNTETLSMWKTFAKLQTPERGYFTIWEVNFSGGIYLCGGGDYKSDTVFVRMIPGMPELIEKAYTLYRWSGDEKWIKDADLTNFYESAMDKCIKSIDDNNDGIGEGHFNDMKGPNGSYCEGSSHGFGVGGDNISSTWAAYNAYAALLTAMGKLPEADVYREKANKVKAHYDMDWWNAGENCYYSGRSIGLDRWFTEFNQWSKETYMFQAAKCIAEPGAKADALLDRIHSNYLASGKKYNLESFTYLPESFYKYGKNERGWHWLKFIMDSHYNYPEVSMTAIGFVATGMMGVDPDAPRHAVATLGRLTPEVTWVQLDGIPMGSHKVCVKHENNNRTTTLIHRSGSQDLLWEASFPGSHASLQIDGVTTAATQKTINGVSVSYVAITMAVGQQKTASIPNDSSEGKAP